MGVLRLVKLIPNRWLPVMKAYESGSGAYFATPPVNLIYAFHESLSQITKPSPSLPERFKLHKEASQKIKGLAAEFGIKQVPVDPAYSANGMTAVRFVGRPQMPELTDPSSFISPMVFPLLI